MAYFPFYFELEGKKGVIIGGGKVALEKVSKLASFGAELTVIAPRILPEITEYENVRTILKEFAPDDVSGADYLIAATDDEEMNARLFALCREKHIPINVVDDKDKCDFIFPSVIRRGKLVASVTSSGASPQVAVSVRKRFEKIIPENIEDILDYLEGIREEVKSLVPDAGKRHRIFKKAADAALELGRPLREEELEEIIDNELKKDDQGIAL